MIKTYFQNGIYKEIPYFLEDDELFYLQELPNSSCEKYIYPGDDIVRNLDIALVDLYDKLRDLYFKDTDEYYRELPIMPIFVQEAGQDSDSGLTAEDFKEWIQKPEFTRLPNFYRHLCLVDSQFWVGTIQNLLSGMEDSFTRYFTLLTQVGTTEEVEPTSPNATMMVMAQSSRELSSALESYFIKAYSILDMLCKICSEIEYPTKDFDTYKKLKHSETLWGARKYLKINGRKGTIFEKCDLVSIIEAVRNEVVHNGAWELNPKVFIRYEDGKVAERFMLFPDIREGHLATVKNRRHFFADGTKVNSILPQIHLAFQTRLLNTVSLINK